MSEKKTDPRLTAILEQFFSAMQAAGKKEQEMMQLFADDAVYIEPFSGAPREHRGKEAIRKVMREGWAHPLPEMRLELSRVQTQGDSVVADWTCYSPALPGGQGMGTNEFVLRDGAIVRLETRFRME